MAIKLKNKKSAMTNVATRVAVVTGAAQGLGQGFAVRLANDGYQVIGVDRVKCSQTGTMIKEQGGNFKSFVIDLAEPMSIEIGVKKILRAYKAVDVLVNNAGVIPNVAFEKIDLDAWRRLMAVNLDAPFLLSKAFISGMVDKGRGRIINIASNTLGLKVPGFVHYVSSKGGIIGLTRSLASEFGDRGITVNAVSPGLTRTHGMMDPNRRGPGGVTTEQEIEFLAQLQAIPRGGEVSDLVGTVSFLASDDASFITGQTISVDGGLWRL